MKSLRHPRRALALAALLALPAFAASAQSMTYRQLAVLQASQGTYPTSPLTRGPDGLLYGVASEGGAFGKGSVYRLEADDSITVLHSFAADDSEGFFPSAGLLLASDGWLYGGTPSGSQDGDGTRGALFRVSTAGEFVLVHRFTAADHGIFGPRWTMTQDTAGNFYWTTGGRPGSSLEHGGIVRMSPDGTLAVLYRFQDTTDGADPQSPLMLGQDGTLYGTASSSHGQYGGTVFAYAPGGHLRVLHTFAPTTDGCMPWGALARGTDGLIYGSTYFCGNGSAGTIYSVSQHGDFAVLHSFSGSDPLGFEPQGGVVVDGSGMLYSTASGGVGYGGTVFSMSTKGKHKATVLHSFVQKDGDGLNPYAVPTLLPDGTIVGATVSGGPDLTGTAYQLTPAD